VKEAVKMGGPEEEIPDISTLTKYLPTIDILLLMDNHNPDTLRIWDARDLVLEAKKFFKR
jgi:hypothetical protein